MGCGKSTLDSRSMADTLSEIDLSSPNKYIASRNLYQLKEVQEPSLTGGPEVQATLISQKGSGSFKHNCIKAEDQKTKHDHSDDSLSDDDYLLEDSVPVLTALFKSARSHIHVQDDLHSLSSMDNSSPISKSYRDINIPSKPSAIKRHNNDRTETPKSAKVIHFHPNVTSGKESLEKSDLKNTTNWRELKIRKEVAKSQSNKTHEKNKPLKNNDISSKKNNITNMKRDTTDQNNDITNTQAQVLSKSNPKSNTVKIHPLKNPLSPLLDSMKFENPKVTVKVIRNLGLAP